MESNFKKILFYEYRGFVTSNGISTSIDDLDLTEKEFKQLCYLSENSLKTGSVFNIGQKTIKAKHFVGVLSSGGIQVQILPKLLAKESDDGNSLNNKILKNLMYLLSYTHNLKITESEVSDLSKFKDDFLEIYIRIFSSKLLRLLNKGFPSRYIRKEEDLGFVKGKILFNEYIKSNIVNKSKIYCEYDDFSEDNIVTRILKFTSIKLHQVTKDMNTKSDLKKIIRKFSYVKDTCFSYNDVKNVNISRTNESFSQVFNLAKMFLSKMRPDFYGANSEQISILFNMNDLFEEFIFEFMKNNKKKFHIESIYSQKGKRLVKSMRSKDSLSKEKKSLFNTFTDIFIRFDKDIYPTDTLVIDTKYKVLNDSGETHYGIANSDVYQVLTYKMIHKNKNSFPKVALMYPQDKKNLDFEFDIASPDDISFFSLTIDMSLDLRQQKNRFIDEIKSKFEFVMKDDVA
jgi:5-methylcytosine-specific restriction enzyme subunit McrC